MTYHERDEQSPRLDVRLEEVATDSPKPATYPNEGLQADRAVDFTASAGEGPR